MSTEKAEQQVTCPVCKGSGVKYSSLYLYGATACLMCGGIGKVKPAGEGRYERISNRGNSE